MNVKELFLLYLKDLFDIRFFLLYTYAIYFLMQMIWILDDNTPFICSFEINRVLSKLKIEVDKMFKWFQENYSKLSTERYHLTTCNLLLYLLVLATFVNPSKSKVDIKISNKVIKSESRTKLLCQNIQLWLSHSTSM